MTSNKIRQADGITPLSYVYSITPILDTIHPAAAREARFWYWNGGGVSKCWGCQSCGKMRRSDRCLAIQADFDKWERDHGPVQIAVEDDAQLVTDDGPAPDTAQMQATGSAASSSAAPDGVAGAASGVAPSQPATATLKEPDLPAAGVLDNAAGSAASGTTAAVGHASSKFPEGN